MKSILKPQLILSINLAKELRYAGYDIDVNKII